MGKGSSCACVGHRTTMASGSRLVATGSARQPERGNQPMPDKVRMRNSSRLVLELVTSIWGTLADRVHVGWSQLTVTLIFIRSSPPGASAAAR